MPLKLVDSTHYHLWTDALHARELARETKNEWDRSTYARWAILSAWTAFESASSDALGATGLGNRFRDNFDSAVDAKGLLPIDWGSGLWQRTMAVYEGRKRFVHLPPGMTTERLNVRATEAEIAIHTLREAIRAVYTLVGSGVPQWVEDDTDPGWGGPRGATLSASLTITKMGADQDPNAVRIAYVINGREYTNSIELAGTPHGPLFEALIQNLNAPVSALRAYQGAVLVEERKVNARGSDLGRK